MFCTRCGKRIDDDSRFCSYCGTLVDRTDDEPTGELAVAQSREMANVETGIESPETVVAEIVDEEAGAIEPGNLVEVDSFVEAAEDASLGAAAEPALEAGDGEETGDVAVMFGAATGDDEDEGAEASDAEDDASGQDADAADGAGDADGYGNADALDDLEEPEAFSDSRYGDEAPTADDSSYSFGGGSYDGSSYDGGSYGGGGAGDGSGSGSGYADYGTDDGSSDGGAPRKRSKKPLVIAIIIVVILAAGIACALTFGDFDGIGSSSSSSSSSQTEESDSEEADDSSTQTSTASTDPDDYILSVNEENYIAGQTDIAVFTVETPIGFDGSCYLYADDGTNSVEMLDDGEGQDLIEGDGIYTCKVAIAGQSTQELSYYAVCDSVTTASISVFIYADPTDEEIQDQQNYIDKIEEADASYADDDGNIAANDADSAVDAVEQIAMDAVANGAAFRYTVGENSVSIDFVTGVTYVYQPSIKGTYAADGTVYLHTYSISTMQPAYDFVTSLTASYLDLPSGITAEYELTDAAAESVEYQLDNCTFSEYNDLDNADVTLEDVADIGTYDVVIWQGHGGYDSTYHSYIVLATEFDSEAAEETGSSYREDVVRKRVLDCNGSEAFTAAYVEEYCGNLTGTLIYFGCCYSGADSVLADAFLDKGATAVVGQSDSILCLYGDLIQYTTVSMLGQINPDTTDYYTLSEALAYAQDLYGTTDADKTGISSAEGATSIIYGSADALNYQLATLDEDADSAVATVEDTGEGTYDYDIVLVMDVSGSMSGNPIKQAKAAAASFVRTQFDGDVCTGVVTYDDEGYTIADLSDDYSYLVECIGSDMVEGGDTNMGDGLSDAVDLLNTGTASNKVIVLMSDGLPNEGLSEDELIAYAEEIKDAGVRIYTLGINEGTSGQELLEAIASDGCHYNLEGEDDLQGFFTDIAAAIDGTLFMYLEIECPVDVTVTYEGETLTSVSSSENTRTSFGTLTYVDSDDSAYPAKVLRLEEGASYTVEIDAFDSGEVSYTIGFCDDTGEYVDFRTFDGIEVESTTSMQTVAETSDVTTLLVDQDGDGLYEQTYSASANSTAELVDNRWATILGMVVVAAVAVLVGWLIAKKAGKKKI